MSATECTVVTFTFGEEPVPYRSKISGRTVTLRQFKDILPKKGNYKCVDNHWFQNYNAIGLTGNILLGKRISWLLQFGRIIEMCSSNMDLP